jgi:hypothetical protein
MNTLRKKLRKKIPFIIASKKIKYVGINPTKNVRWVPVAHTCNHSYLGGKDQKNQGLKPAWANSS